MRIAKHAARHWRREFAVYRAPDGDSAAIRARHLSSLTHLTPLLMATNALGALMTVTALQATIPLSERLVWLVATLLICIAGVASWNRRRVNPPKAVSVRGIRRTIVGAGVSGLPWAAATAAWFGRAGDDGQLLLSSIVVGFMCAGAFALTPVPQAALLYLAMITSGALIGLATSGGLVGTYLQAMVLIYCASLGACALINARVHTARLVSERESERKGQLVSLLLRDFEEHSADLLWEVDHNGYPTHVSDRLAEALGTTAKGMTARGMLETLADRAPTDPAAIARLGVVLDGERPFRDQEVRVSTVRGPRWWSFTAKPLRDALGAKCGWRGVISDVTQAQETKARMQALAHCDHLTGLANRTLLSDRVAATLRRIDEAGLADRPAALVCIDIDHFKSINDTHGHGGGDAVLVQVAARLRERIRREDLPARLGGDEFAILVEPGLGVDEIRILTTRLIGELSRPYAVPGGTLSLSVSVGVALLPANGRTLDELLAHADLALYAAKEAGRARCIFFEASLGDRHRRKVVLAQALRGALERREFELAWQPQIRLSDGRVAGCEALLRWTHPQLGRVSPAEFVPIAENSGLITRIGAWVLREACKDATTLPDDLCVAVNVSPAQLMQDDFLALVNGALTDSGLPARRLEIEVTESLLMGAVPVALANLHALRALGVRVQLDDFGTGYSALAYLRKFPFDGLKIDRAFVAELTSREDARAIVRAIVDLARSLGMTTIAEGVEDDEQYSILRRAGCDLAQGYLMARPMPGPELHHWVQAHGSHQVASGGEVAA